LVRIYQSMNTITINDLPQILETILMEFDGPTNTKTIFEVFFTRYFHILMRQREDLSLDKNTRNLYLTWNNDIRWASTNLEKSFLEEKGVLSLMENLQ
jgi:hypothetical protein